MNRQYFRQDTNKGKWKLAKKFVKQKKKNSKETFFY